MAVPPGGHFLCLEFSRVVLPALSRLYDLYERLLRGALRHRALVLAGALSMLVTLGVAVAKFGAGIMAVQPLNLFDFGLDVIRSARENIGR